MDAILNQKCKFTKLKTKMNRKVYKIFKVQLIIFSYLFISFIFAEDLVIISNGKRIINDTISISENKTRILVKNEATFTDNKGNYGISTCLGTLEKNLKNIEFNLKCENIDQNNLRYWTKLNRGQGDLESGIGTVEFIGGEGGYKKLIGKKCKYAVKYFRKDIFFFRQVCKM